MNRNVRGMAVIAAGALVLSLATASWLGVRLPVGAPHRAGPFASASPSPSLVPADAYDVMGTLTINGRSIPSARLAPGESSLVEWAERNGIGISAIALATNWPPETTSLSDALRGAAVAHAMIVSQTETIFDVVPLSGSLDPSICITSATDGASYQLILAGRVISFSDAVAVHVGAWRNAAVITMSDSLWERIRSGGATEVQCSTK